MRKNNPKLLGQTQTRPKKNRDAQKHLEENHVLTQEELMRWWPFKRLAPHRFPKPVYPDAQI